MEALNYTRFSLGSWTRRIFNAYAASSSLVAHAMFFPALVTIALSIASGKFVLQAPFII